MPEPTPQNTHAVLVGIEKYAAGPTWNLDGPASDVVRFLEFLGARGVPKENIRAYLSPLPENEGLRDKAKGWAAAVEEPTHAALYEMSQALRSCSAGLFFLIWTGHGIITIEGERRLFTSDAKPGDKRNFDLNDLMAALRSDAYPNLDRQGLIIDTCANFVHDPSSLDLPKTVFPKGKGMAGRQQFALYAAAPGEYAKNLTAEKSGLMTRELMATLEAGATEGSWPPDPAAITQKLAERFIQLRQAGEARQTPTTFWFRGWSGEERHFADFDDQSGAGSSLPRLPRDLTIPERDELLQAMLAVPSLLRADARELVLQALRSEISTNISRSSIMRVEAMSILDKCRDYNGLAELLRAVNTYEARSPKMQALVATAARILPEEVPANLLDDP